MAGKSSLGGCWYLLEDEGTKVARPPAGQRHTGKKRSKSCTTVSDPKHFIDGKSIYNDLSIGEPG